MRQIRMLRSIAGLGDNGLPFSYRHGRVYDMPDDRAAWFVSAGKAEYVDASPSRRKPGPTETKVVEPETSEDEKPSEPEREPEPEVTAEPATEPEPEMESESQPDQPRRRGRPRLPRDENGNVIRE